jgi:hypothetical protein
MSGFSSTLIDLETLFLEKLQEKYKLNKRDLKRAFSKFDTDNNGLLDLYELTKGIQLFLNGVKESQVQKLVSKYDLNGDGKISYDEFLTLLTNRTAMLDDDDMSDNMSRPSSAGYGSYRNSGTDHRRSGDDSGGGGRGGKGPAGGERREGGYPSANYPSYPSNYPDDASELMSNDYDASEQGYGSYNYEDSDAGGRGGGYGRRAGVAGAAGAGRGPPSVASSSAASTPTQSDAPSELNPNNPRDVEYRAKIFLENIKAYLIKQAASMRLAGKLQRTTAMMNASEMHESVARDLMIKAFQPYTGQGDGKSREQFCGVELPEFAKYV